MSKSMVIHKNEAKWLLVDNYSYFIGVSNGAELSLDAVYRECDKVVANPLLIPQRTACCTAKYVIFDDDSSLDTTVPGTTYTKYDYNGHTILVVHWIQKDSFDNSDLHKWLVYFIL